MELLFTLASALGAGLMLLAIVRLGRDDGAALARVVVPIALVILIAQMAFGHWSVFAFALLGTVIVSAGALALRGPGREHAPTWIALAVFAAGGLVGGYGLLANGLCRAGDAFNCAGTVFDVLTVAGWAIALAAYGYLAWGALRS